MIDNPYALGLDIDPTDDAAGIADFKRALAEAAAAHAAVAFGSFTPKEGSMSDESNESASTDRTNADLRASAAHAGSVDYAIGGALATFTHGHGWTSNDGLCAKHLNRITAERHMDGASLDEALDEAHAIIMGEYPQARLVEPIEPIEPVEPVEPVQARPAEGSDA